jgi:hypothetical protein
MSSDLNIAFYEEHSEAMSPEQLQQQIQNLRTKYPEDINPLFLLFTGSKDESGVSWCPDCTRAAPVVLTALEEYCPDSVLLVLNCKRSEYRDQSFTYRVNELIQLTSVPTLIRYDVCVQVSV